MYQYVRSLLKDRLLLLISICLVIEISLPSLVTGWAPILAGCVLVSTAVWAYLLLGAVRYQRMRMTLRKYL